MTWLDGNATRNIPTTQLTSASCRNSRMDKPKKNPKKPKRFICVIKQLINMSAQKMHPWCDRDETRQVHFTVKDAKTTNYFLYPCPFAWLLLVIRARSFPDHKYFKVLAMRSTDRNYCKHLSRAQLFHPYEKVTNSHVLQGTPPQKTDSHTLSPWTGERQILMEYFHVCLINANSCIARKKNQWLVKNSINLLQYVGVFFMVMVNTEY